MYPKISRRIFKNDLCRGGACSTDEVRWGTAHLRTDAPAGDIDLLLGQHALIETVLVLLFHAYRAAATADIAGDLVDIGHMDHCDAFFAHTAGSGL